MTRTASRETPAAGPPSGHRPRLLGRPAGSRRRPGRGRVAAAGILVAGFALAGAVLVQRAGRTVDVLVVARPVPVGQSVTAADLSTARAGGSGFAAMAAGRLEQVLGQTAAVALHPGQLLVEDMLTAVAVPAPGRAVVGLALRWGQLPGDGVDAGDRVRIVAVPGRADGTAAAAGNRPPVLAGEATVLSVRDAPDGAGTVVVTVEVPEGDADVLAAHGSAGQVAVVEVAR